GADWGSGDVLCGAGLTGTARPRATRPSAVTRRTLPAPVPPAAVACGRPTAAGERNEWRESEWRARTPRRSSRPRQPGPGAGQPRPEDVTPPIALPAPGGTPCSSTPSAPRPIRTSEAPAPPPYAAPQLNSPPTPPPHNARSIKLRRPADVDWRR